MYGGHEVVELGMTATVFVLYVFPRQAVGVLSVGLSPHVPPSTATHDQSLGSRLI